MHDIAEHIGASFFQVLRFASTEHGKALDEMGSYSDGLLQACNDVSPDLDDPVMQHVRCSSTAILWNRETYVGAGPEGARAYEIMADFGVRFGASIAMHLGPFRHLSLSFTWPHTVSPDPRRLMELQLYALHAEPAFYRVWSQRERSKMSPDQELTPRELETLHLSSRGLKLPAIASAIQRSPRTAEKFAQGAMTKLRAATLIEAVSIAERLQLFDGLRANEASHLPTRRWKHEA